MGETGDLVMLVGELDRELVRMMDDAPDEALAARRAAASLIPPFGPVGDGEGLVRAPLEAARTDVRRLPDQTTSDAPLARVDPRRGWYDDFVAASGFRPRVSGLTEAMDQLAGARDRGEVSSLPVQRVAVVVAVVRAVREFPDDRTELREGIEERALQALWIRGLVRAPDDDDERDPDEDVARELFRRLTDPEAPIGPDDLHAFLISDDNAGLVDKSVRLLPTSCSAHVAPVVDRAGDRLVALAIRADVCLVDVPFHTVAGERGILNPKRWEVSPFWCEMYGHPRNPTGSDAWTMSSHFREHVDLDCDAEILPITVWLHFGKVLTLPEGAVRRFAAREYAMAPEATPPGGPAGNGEVRIDEGALVVRQEAGGHVRVTATKRVEFTRGITEEALAVLSCAVGYGDLVAGFVLDLVRRAGAGARPIACDAARTFVPAGATFDPLDGPVRDLGTTVDACARAASVSLGRLAAGEYTFESFGGDVARSVARSAEAFRRLGEVVAVIADAPSELGDIMSATFALPDGLAMAGGCRLKVTEPLRSLGGRLLHLVQCVPEELPAGRRDFRLLVHAAGARAGLYLGRVEARHNGQGKPTLIDVDVLVP